MINRASIKAEARADLRGKNPSVYLVSLVYLVIVYVIQYLSSRLLLPDFDELKRLILEYDAADTGWLVRYVTAMQPSGLAELLNFALSIILTILSFGFNFFALKISRGIAAGYGDLFDGFGLFFKVFLLSLVMGIFVALWSLLFIIPGIVAAYRYSMAIYILMDDPELGVMDCIRESKRITQGHKGKLFVLDLSFIGWAILSAIPFVSIYTMPYMAVTEAKYYNILSGRHSFGYAGSGSGDDDDNNKQYDNSKDPWEN